MTRKTLILLSVLFVSVAYGRWMQQPQAEPVLMADVFVDPSQLPAACRSNVTVQSVQLFERGSTSETFFVTWARPELACLTKAAVTVNVKRRDGSNGSKTEFVDANNGQALVKVFGSRSDNPGTEVTAVVLANGFQVTATKTAITDI